MEEVQPWLRPPTQDYIEKQMRSGASVSPSNSTSKPLKPYGAATRLFEHQANAPEPTELSSYYGGVSSSAEMKRAALQADWQRLMLMLLCTAQAVAGLVGFMYVSGWTTVSARSRMIQATLILISVSGGLGGVGAWRRWSETLQAFFIAQIWSLSTVLSQFLAAQQLNKRRDVFCLGRDDTQNCEDHMGLGTLALGGAIVLVYVSMFFADGLSEHLQDQLEDEDNQQIVKFVWLMNKKTLLGIHRFEEQIHHEFEKLVGMGFLKLKEG
ncbi:hypothetical protein AB1Y20_019969 [Prymnesium parvum]|uniref:Uncharacterized protein n=1 Tax=Prymnesium parvum TaxID=97485 RepID=A0AB34JVJ4_PRYPA|mmetsp:Transcript_29265/g.73029  ORF Transcript_29265/g.73029 Transcript_29265/m.73029 type:complete len:268 (+) Transcript_29265:25-828(+)|eukprot:CAMPEP_0182801158 /NCGR_PEP_ID=MMETSP0006_2-20121128/2802_1 /TAXON_ID=97485 /ORGANISM="Prymnesium parvum, Strain Texoma1" /LENGTH=267 /DNA_ID=CAMNT_0024926459 /DNA_START=19 /DNA_END=822 /DNA_ORIENTATION=+